ncbi:MAG: GGDEF domain-containing protein [Oscillospiraceae bacterium]|nr:GGDEF domain-containing protein [Oscillospiraceae bacterium]
MDYQAFTDRVAMPCCVLAVEQTSEGTCGRIRILCANAAYKATMGPQYYDNMPYEELVPQDNKFEDFCFRAAVLGQRMHAYVETKAMGTWTDQTLIPLASDTPGVGYCQFIFEFTQHAEAERMASVSADTSALVIKACITLMGARDFRESVGSVLDDVLDAAGAMACRIMLVDHERCEAVNFCERVQPGAFVRRSVQDVIDYALICSWEDVIGVSNALILKDERDYAWLEQENPAWAASMRKNNITSLVIIPLRRSGSVLGYLYVVNFDVARVVEVKELLELLSFFLGSEISNHLLLQRLDVMSHTDALTGLNNRNAMIRRMEELRGNPNASVGVLNLDLNGLKRVNDEQGHEAGDRLLVQAGELLRKVFYQQDIFRTGGDEFIVIIRGISRETFETKAKRLRAAVEKNTDVSFAIGDCWAETTGDLTCTFHRADERMYADKDAFYRTHPELRRR